MPRKQVVECQCDRCERLWYETPSKERVDSQAAVKFVGPIAEEQVDIQFGLLCSNCAKAVRNYIASILREPKAKKDEEEVEVEVEEEPSERTTPPRDLKRASGGG